MGKSAVGLDVAQSILNTHRSESDLPRIIKLFALLIQVNPGE